MSSHRNDITYSARWFSFGRWVGRFMPRSLARFCASGLGYFYAACNPARSRSLETRVRILGSTSHPKAGRIFASFARVLADYFILGSRPLSDAVSLVSERTGYEHLEAAHQAKKGCLLLTMHLGFFELGGAIMKEMGFPLVILTNPEPTPHLTNWRSEYRKRWDVETHILGSDEFDFLSVTKLLGQGKFVAALFDRSHNSRSSQVPFPNGILTCASSVLLLALLAKCPIIPMAVTSKKDTTYLLHACSPIWVEKKSSPQATLDYYSQQVVQSLAPILEKHPNQWYRFAPNPEDHRE